jgi:hypothetical protein
VVLQFPPPKIAWAALWIADLLNVDSGNHFSKLPRGSAFFDKFDITPEVGRGGRGGLPGAGRACPRTGGLLAGKQHAGACARTQP